MFKRNVAKREAPAKVRAEPRQAGAASTHRQRPQLLEQEVRAALIGNRERYLAYFRRRVGTPDEAEDALQEFCLRALQSSHQVADRARLHGWLSRVLRSTVVDRYRRNAIRERALAEFAAITPETLESLETFDECRCLDTQLLALRPDVADLLLRADLHEQPHAAMASELGLSIGNVAVRLHRARKALREKLLANCETCQTWGFLRCGCGTVTSSPSRTRSNKITEQRAVCYA